MDNTPPFGFFEESEESILERLLDEQADEDDRILAAQAAGDYVNVNDRLADALLSILGDDRQPEKLRRGAAIALGPALEAADIDGFDDPDDAPISEQTFQRIQEVLRSLYRDAGVPEQVRRSILEASVRAPEAWHRDAVAAAYSSGDDDWRLSAVFAMRWLNGFDDEILESLQSENEDIHYEAVCAAGNWELQAAWSHVAALVASPQTDKDLLLAAIEALATIRPGEAGPLLVDLSDSDDEDISEAAYEAMSMAELHWELDEEDEDDEYIN